MILKEYQNSFIYTYKYLQSTYCSNAPFSSLPSISLKIVSSYIENNLKRKKSQQNQEEEEEDCKKYKYILLIPY